MSERDYRYARRSAEVTACPYDGTNAQEIELTLLGVDEIVAARVYGSDVFDEAAIVEISVRRPSSIGRDPGVVRQSRLVHRDGWVVFEDHELDVVFDEAFQKRYEPLGRL